RARMQRAAAECRAVRRTRGRRASYRGRGRREAASARERLIDIAAQRLGLGRLERRRRNFITPAEMPYDVGGAAVSQRTVYNCGDYASALDHALDALGYEAARKEQAEARRQGRLVGLGVGCLVEKAGLGPWEYARVEVA